MSDTQVATRDARLDSIVVLLQQLAADTRALALRVETLHGKLDAAIDIHERLAAVETRVGRR